MQVLHLKYHPDYHERAKLTFENYDLIDIISNGDERFASKKLKPKKQRVCLFCGRAYGDTKFSSDAHLVSKHIGNTSLFSDFECHDCNLRFGRMEDDLSKFIGISKSLAKGKDGKMEGFKGKFLSVHSRTFIGEDILIISPKDVIRDGNKTYIRYIKNPYTPIIVYKSLIKFAISILPNDIVKTSFPKALSLLNDQLQITAGAALSFYVLPFNFALPLYLLVFKKKNPKANFPTYMMSLYFNNYIINLPLLMHEEDGKHTDQRTFVQPPPYFVNESYLEAPVLSSGVKDFSSREKVTDEWEEILFTVPDSSANQLTAYDYVTGKMEERSFNNTGIKYMIITKEGVTVDAKALYEFIRDQMENITTGDI